MYLQAHPWFNGVNWDKLYENEAAYKPTVSGDLDTQNFEKFTASTSLLCIKLCGFYYRINNSAP